MRIEDLRVQIMQEGDEVDPDAVGRIHMYPDWYLRMLKREEELERALVDDGSS